MEGSHTSLSIGEIRDEISKTLEKNHIPDSMAEVSFERDEFFLRVFPNEIDDRVINEIIAVSKRHIENWRIHTFDRNYVSIQALNNSVFQTENLLSNLKIKISALAGEKLIEISKKGQVNAAELNLMVNIIRQFCAVKVRNPVEHLEALGCPVYHPDREKISLEDFAGYNEVKTLIRETVILPMKNPDAYDSIVKSTRAVFESNRPKAVLFSGPPGVGKTTMARILARETGCYLVYVPLENIMSAYYGESSKRLAMIFDIAASAEKENFILFLDEIDALAPSRNEKLFEATRRMLSVLLRKIDGIESRKNYITIGATNRREDIDEALISRFETVIDFGYPKKEDINRILEMYARHLDDTQRGQVASRLEGFSPRAIKDICNRAERSQARINIQSGKADLPGSELYIQAASGYTKS